MALVSVTPPKEGKSHRTRRVRRGAGEGGRPEGFRTNSGEQRWGGTAGGILRPRALPGDRPALPPAATPGGHGAARPPRAAPA